MVDSGNGVFRIEFTTVEVGSYAIDVTVSGKQGKRNVDTNHAASMTDLNGEEGTDKRTESEKKTIIELLRNDFLYTT